MNTNTGQIYWGMEEIRQAIERGEPIEPIGPGVAERDKAFRDLFDKIPKVTAEDMQAEYAQRLTAATIVLTKKAGK